MPHRPDSKCTVVPDISAPPSPRARHCPLPYLHKHPTVAQSTFCLNYSSFLPPRPFEIPPPCHLPPPGGRPSLYCFAWQYLLRWFVFPICHTQVLALLSHCFESVTCVYSVILHLQRRCAGCRVPFSDSRCFLPVTVYGTTYTHLVHMCWPLFWGLYQNGRQFCYIRYIRPGGVTQVDHGSAQLSRLEAMVVASPKSAGSPEITPMASQPQTLAVCIVMQGTTVCLEIPLQSPPRGETVTWRTPPPPGGETVACYGGRFQGGGEGKRVMC